MSTCARCGKELPTTPRSRAFAHFCSGECRHLGYPEKSCRTCGRSFKPRSYERAYCSPRCTAQAPRPRPTAKCELCGQRYRCPAKEHAKRTFCTACYMTRQRTNKIRQKLCGSGGPPHALLNERLSRYLERAALGKPLFEES